MLVDTTCGDVMSVWKRVRQYSKENVTSIIHGKAKHEETKATSSQARAYGNGHYLVVFNLAETDYVCNYILTRREQEWNFSKNSKAPIPPALIPDMHLQAVGVANQTTMLRGETEEVQRRFRAAMEKKYGAENIGKHFRFFDTICGATQDRQDALEKMLARADEPAHRRRRLQFVEHFASGRNGRSQAADLFHQERRENAVGQTHRPLRPAQKKEVETRDWLPAGKITVGVTAGASCPNNLIEDTIRRLFELRGISVQELLAS